MGHRTKVGIGHAGGASEGRSAALSPGVISAVTVDTAGVSAAFIARCAFYADFAFAFRIGGAELSCVLLSAIFTPQADLQVFSISSKHFFNFAAKFSTLGALRIFLSSSLISAP